MMKQIYGLVSTHLPISLMGALSMMSGAAHSQTVQDRVSGEEYVEFGKDHTGLKHYSVSGAMCVVHNPKCGSVGHNGKDHFFTTPLPDGARIDRVDYKVFWPDPSINHTDRGGIGSSGSYGASQSLKRSPPLVSVHWENACQSSTGGKNWSALPVTYQISFIVSHPKGVVLSGSAVSSATPFRDVCTAGDQPHKITLVCTPYSPLPGCNNR